MRMGPFGSCCSDLKDAMENTSNPLIHVEADGILYLHIGFIGAEAGVTLLEKPVIFCPFCGKQLQDKNGLASKSPAK